MAAAPSATYRRELLALSSTLKLRALISIRTDFVKIFASCFQKGTAGSSESNPDKAEDFLKKASGISENCISHHMQAGGRNHNTMEV